jgi:hypothetical protein
MTQQNTSHNRNNQAEPEFSGNPAELPRFEQTQNNTYNFEPECALPGTALTCLNGLRHGHRARTLFIPGEQPQDFYNMLAEDFETHKPTTVQESGFVTDATLARWYLWRRQRSYSKCEFELYCDADQEDTLSPNDLRHLANFDRYRIQAERGLARAMAGLRHLKKPEANDERWRTQHEMQKKRFDLDLQRFELHKEREILAIRKAEAEANKFNPHDYRHYLGRDDGQTSIDQIAHISQTTDGITELELEPSNDVVQKIVENRKLFIFDQPTCVARSFFFKGGIIPREYEWIRQNAKPELLLNIDKPGNCLHIPLDLISWHGLFNYEKKILEKAQRAQKPKAA